MPKMFVNQSKLLDNIISLDDISARLGELSDTLCCENTGFYSKASFHKHLVDSLDESTLSLDKLMQEVKALSVCLSNVCEQYEVVESKLSGGENPIHSARTSNGQATSAISIVGWFKKLFSRRENESTPIAYEIDSIVFDDEGSYGGDQGAPQFIWLKKNRDELYETVRKYYPRMTDEEIRQYLIKLNSEGCGYVAIVNTILAAYEGKSDEFERTFGFPMYAADGDLNYNQLLVDFYSATDNHNKILFWDVTSKIEDIDEISGRGTTPASQKYRAKLYLRQKGVDVKIKTSQIITIKNFEEISHKKYIVINYHYGNLRKADGSIYQYIDGGHSMVVTGITEDGRFIVSSWGEKLYIDPNEKVRDGLHVTSFNFITYRY